jgi:hypothetical protein
MCYIKPSILSEPYLQQTNVLPATEHTSNEEMMGILSKKGRVAKCNNHLGSSLLFLFLHVTLTLHVQLYNSMM